MSVVFYLMGSLVTFLLLFPKAPIPAVEKQVALLCFLHILSLLNLTSAFPVL